MLKKAGWILIILGSLETLFLIYAVINKNSFTGGSILYVIIGLFLIKGGIKSYKFSQFIFTMIILFIPASIIFNLVMSIQIYLATDVSVSSDYMNIYNLIIFAYVIIIAYLVMLLHHPKTRDELSLERYDSEITTLYIPKH